MKSLLRRACLALTFIGVGAVSAGAQELSGIPGAYADIGLGVRALGMGGAYVAVAGDEAAARWNPAALGVQNQRSAGFSWTRQMNLVPYNYLSGTWPMQAWGLGCYAETSGDDVLRENTVAVAGGVPLDRFPQLADLRGLSAGISAKFRWASFGNNPDGGVGQVKGNAVGYGIDLGLYYEVPLIRGLTTGLLWRDVLNTIHWNSNSPMGTYSEGVPTTLTLGVAYRYGRRSLFTFDFKPALYKDVYTRFAMGAEYKLLKVIALRAGLAQDLGSVRPNRDVTVGLGLKLNVWGASSLEAGVSYLFNELMNTPRVGLAFRW